MHKHIYASRRPRADTTVSVAKTPEAIKAFFDTTSGVVEYRQSCPDGQLVDDYYRLYVFLYQYYFFQNHHHRCSVRRPSVPVLWLLRQVRHEAVIQIDND